MPTITVSGPNASLAYLRALAIKAGHYASRAWTRIRVSFTLSSQLLRAAATTALAVLGSDSGYDLTRLAIRRATGVTARLIRHGVALLGRGIRALGRMVARGIGVVSPTTAASVSAMAQQWIVEPVQDAMSTVGAWITDIGIAVWDLTGTGLVRTITTRAAQIAGLSVGLHVLTAGGLATSIVRAIPWAMNGIIWLTQPHKAVALVGASFASAMGVALVLLMTRRPGTTPEPEPQNLFVEDLVDPATPDLLPGPAQRVNLREVASSVNVEITTDGSVVVHGVPDDLPDDIALHIAHIAADAATDRLRAILLHRPVPNRDDRRLLTKVAREAVRKAA